MAAAVVVKLMTVSQYCQSCWLKTATAHNRHEGLLGGALVAVQGCPVHPTLIAPTARGSKFKDWNLAVQPGFLCGGFRDLVFQVMLQSIFSARVGRMFF